MNLRTIGFLLFLCAVASAQDRGGITGTVTDPTGTGVAHAKVVVTNTARGEHLDLSTTDAGLFSATNLIAGLYQVDVEAPGFHTSTIKSVVVQVGEVARADLQLQLGSVSERVEVTSTSTGLENDTSDVGTNVSTEAILNLPLEVSGAVRDPLAFTKLTPGFNGATGNSAINFQAHYTINGSQSGAAQILVDGGDIELTGVQSQFQTGVSTEAVQEFKVMASNFPAEYGRTTGGIINLTLKSGTNSFHGDAYELLRNDDFDARGFFNPTRRADKQNDFGGIFSGPVRIPKLYNGHDRTFFMFAYEGFRYNAGALNQIGTFPTDDTRKGNFSALVDPNGNQIPIYDPASTVVQPDGTVLRTPFPGNIIPQSRIDPVAAKISALLPQLDFPNQLANNIYTDESNHVKTHILDFKVDHQINSKNKLTGSYNTDEENNLDTWGFGAIGQSGGVDSITTYVRLAEDYIVSPTILNHVQFSFSRRRFNQAPQYFGNYASQLGLTGVNNLVFPTIDITGYITPGGDTFGGGPFGEDFKARDNSFQETESLSVVRGKHSMKFGTEVRKQQFNVKDLTDYSGYFDFDPAQTSLPNATQTTGDGYASFLLGAVNTSTLNYSGNSSAHRFAAMSFYAQDDWKVSSRLTLNLGLRYDRFWPMSDATGRLSSFDPTEPNPGAGGILGALAFAGNGPGRTGQSSFQKIYNKAFGPRVGLAYSLDSRTVFRAAYGIYYQELKEPGWGGVNDGFFIKPTISSADGFSPAFQLGAGFPQNFPTTPTLDPSLDNGSNIPFADPEPAHVPTAQNWQASIQRQLSSKLTLDVAYVATKGTHLITANKIYNQVNPEYLSLGNLLNADINSPEAQAAGIAMPYAGFTGTVAQALRPYPQYQTIIGSNDYGSDKTGNSTYNALQVKMQGKITRDLTMLLAYAWSKNLTDGSDNRDLDTFLPNYTQVQNGYDRAAEKTYAAADIPQSFVTNFIYEVPFGRGHSMLNHGWASAALGGWALGSVLTYQSGQVIPTPTPAFSDVPLFAGTIRPDVVPGQNPLTPQAQGNFDPGSDLYLNANAWSSPPAFQFGNAARMSGARTKPLLNEDFSLLKIVNFGEHLKLQFRAEAFNIFNRTVFGFPATDLGGSDFGTIVTQANKPRSLQLGAKLLF